MLVLAETDQHRKWKRVTGRQTGSREGYFGWEGDGVGPGGGWDQS